MRPRRLEVEGFTAFRAKTVLDFEGADLFAFVGPTGSGKSSLVDALLFALYGVVPRLGKATVEPVVSLGRNEARVRFDFSVGENDYTAARVVRRTKTGATTAEARLEGGVEPIMGADEVTAAVEKLLGLGFDHFTKCVVLPQGQFAAFLQDPAAKRQELLRQLLDLGRYRRVRELALERQRTADNRVEVLGQQMADLAFATDDALRVATTRRERLSGLVAEAEKAETEMEAIAVQTKEASEQARRAQEQARLTEAIAKPPNLDRLAAAVEQADEKLQTAGAASETASVQLDNLEKAAAKMVDAAVLSRLAEQHSRLTTETEAEAGALVAVEKAAEAARRAIREADEAEKTVAQAVDALDAARREHSAHALAAHLEQGAPCPVCRQTVADLPPDDDVPPELPELEQYLAQARRTAKEAASDLVTSNEQLAAVRSRHEELTKRVAELTDVLADQPDRDELSELVKRRHRLDLDVKEARVAASSAREKLDAAQKAVVGVSQDIEQARKEYDRARDRVAILDPPSAERDNLGADWDVLVKWAEETGATRTNTAEKLFRVEAEGAQKMAEIEKAILDGFRTVGLDFDSRRVQKLRDLGADALAAANQEVTRLEAAREKTTELAGQRAIHDEAGSVAKTLARHLAANGFEGWLMAEALEALVEGANDRLDDLSSGAFSLALAKRDFRVIDHRNADERRSVRTLSGGETFLVSLALALALAEQLASMSVHGVAHLESMFLDEGFGTLDAETLDTVATVIHELGSDGRAIGLITHVKDLAEQVPVRFEVRPGPGGATVERVGA